MERKRLSKVLVVISLAVALAVLPLLAACTSEVEEEAEPMQFIIGGCGIGSTYYPVAVALQTIFNTNVEGIRTTAIVTGCSLQNIRMMDEGKILLGLAPDYMSREAYHGGTERFPEAMKITHASSMFATWRYWITLDKNIETLQDVKGKRVAMGEPGGTELLTAEAMLNHVGLKKDVDYTPIMVGQREAVEALIDGRADVYFEIGGKTHAAIVELSAVKDVYFIPFPEDRNAMLAALKEAGLNQSLGTLPKDTFRGMNKDYPTFGAPSGLIVAPDMDENLAYTLIKTMWENTEALAEVTAICKELSINEVQMDFGLPMHPGALKYYKEVGVLTEDPYKG